MQQPAKTFRDLHVWRKAHDYALGSRYYLILAQDLGYGETQTLMLSLEEVSRLLNSYSKAILTPDF